MPRTTSKPGVRGFGAWMRQWSIADWLIVGYLTLINLALFTVPPSAERTRQFTVVGCLWLVFVAVLAVMRGGLAKQSRVPPLVYRLSHLAVLVTAYMAYTDYLPVMNQTTVDIALYEFDMKYFGFEPAVVFDAYVTPELTEWFAFFYYGYFFLVASHSLLVLLFARSRRFLNEYAIGMILIYTLGQTLYLVVPGYGPYRALPGLFSNQLPEGVWWSLVQDIVSSGGAQMDIFPSLHTAAPVFIFLLSFANRHRMPFRFTWPFVGFAALNIMIATMYLRWHYVVDVVAGWSLACLAVVVAKKIARWEPAYRDRAGLTPAWPPIVGEPSPIPGTVPRPVAVTHAASTSVARGVDAITDP